MQNDDPLTVLFSLYTARTDLQRAFPECCGGDLTGLLQWAVTDGVTIDSCRDELIPHAGYYTRLLEDHDGMREIATTVPLTMRKETPWDHSRDQYIPAGKKIYWETLGKVARYQFECITGDPGTDILSYVIGVAEKMYTGEKLRCGLIGCDEITRPEVRFMNSGIFKEILVMDIAAGLLSQQQSLADRQGLSGIRYVCADMNTAMLDENSFDLIFAWGTVHHVDDLPHFFLQVQRALKEGALFIMREYVGPDRIQLSDDQLAITNALLRLIPDRYRQLPDGTLKEQERRVNREELIRNDPSESIHSGEIVPTMKKYLEILRYCPTGGTLLQPLLNGIAGNFESDQEGSDILDAVIGIERALVRAGLLPSDYMFAIAKKR